MRSTAVLAAVILCQILTARAYCADSIRQKVVPHDCDSLQNAQIADLVFGRHEWSLVILHPPWLEGDSMIVMRVRSGPIHGLIEYPFECAQAQWFRGLDTTLSVTIRVIDSTRLFYERQPLAPTWYKSTYCALVRSDGATVPSTEILLLDTSFSYNGVIHSGMWPNLESIECIDSLGDVDHALGLELVSTNVLTGESAEIVGFWAWNGFSSRFLGSIVTHEYKNRPSVYLHTTEWAFRDVVGDGQREIVLRSNTGLGAGQGSNLRDSASIGYRMTIARDSTIEWELIPKVAMLDNGTIIPLRSGPIRRVYPEWNADTAPLLSNSDSLAAERINQSIAWILSTERSTDLESNTIPSERVSREGTAMLRASLTGDSIQFEASVVDSFVSAARASSRSPLYDVLFWIDPRQPVDITDSLTADSCFLVALHANGASSSAMANVFRIVHDNGNCDYQLAQSLDGAFARPGGSIAYSYSCMLPRESLGLQAGTDRIACGFSAEVVNHPVAVCSLKEVSHSRSDKSFSRRNPATWGTLMIGIRQDFSDPRN